MEPFEEISLIEPGHFGASKDQVLVVKNFVEADHLDKIQKFVETINIWNSEKPPKIEGDPVYNDALDYWANKLCDSNAIRKLSPEIYDLVQFYIQKMQKEIENKYNIEIRCQTPVICRWFSGNQLLPHADKQLNDGSPSRFPTYDIGSVIYWNDNFEGGELYYPNYDLEIKVEAGMFVAHPGDIHYLHGVKLVSSGTRWTTPCFHTITKLKD